MICTLSVIKDKESNNNKESSVLRRGSELSDRQGSEKNEKSEKIGKYEKSRKESFQHEKSEKERSNRVGNIYISDILRTEAVDVCLSLCKDLKIENEILNECVIKVCMCIFKYPYIFTYICVCMSVSPTYLFIHNNTNFCNT